MSSGSVLSLPQVASDGTYVSDYTVGPWNMSSAMVRTAGRAGLAMYNHGMAKKRMRYSPAFQAARAAISHVYNNRTMYSNAAIRFKKSLAAYRRQRSRAQSNFGTRNIGFNRGASSTPSNQTGVTAFGGRNTRTLYTQGLTDIARGSDPNQRTRDVASIRGVKCCFEIRNRMDIPMTVHIAILAHRNGSGTPSNSNFFRAQGILGNATRAVDFGVERTSLDLNCLPINTDKWVVLRHKKYRLGVDPPVTTAASYNTQKANFKMIEFYQKIKRQVRYDGDSQAQPINGALWMVIWADCFGDPANTQPRLNAWDMSYRTITYFRNPRN